MVTQTKNAGAVTLETMMSRLEALGDESIRKIYARQGAGDRQFGVLRGDLRGLAKKIKTNHPLALQLWGTGNADARSGPPRPRPVGFPPSPLPLDRIRP